MGKIHNKKNNLNTRRGKEIIRLLFFSTRKIFYRCAHFNLKAR